jgi:hypothetical protein
MQVMDLDELELVVDPFLAALGCGMLDPRTSSSRLRMV